MDVDWLAGWEAAEGEMPTEKGRLYVILKVLGGGFFLPKKMKIAESRKGRKRENR